MEKVGLELEGVQGTEDREMDRGGTAGQSAAVLGTGNLGMGAHVNQGLPATSFLYPPRNLSLLSF